MRRSWLETRRGGAALSAGATVTDGIETRFNSGVEGTFLKNSRNAPRAEATASQHLGDRRPGDPELASDGRGGETELACRVLGEEDASGDHLSRAHAIEQLTLD